MGLIINKMYDDRNNFIRAASKESNYSDRDLDPQMNLSISMSSPNYTRNHHSIVPHGSSPLTSREDPIQILFPVISAFTGFLSEGLTEKTVNQTSMAIEGALSMSKDPNTKAVLSNLKEKILCPYCLKNPKAFTTRCGHVFCKECFRENTQKATNFFIVLNQAEFQKFLPSCVTCGEILAKEDLLLAAGQHAQELTNEAEQREKGIHLCKVCRTSVNSAFITRCGHECLQCAGDQCRTCGKDIVKFVTCSLCRNTVESLHLVEKNCCSDIVCVVCQLFTSFTNCQCGQLVDGKTYEKLLEAYKSFECIRNEDPDFFYQ